MKRYRILVADDEPLNHELFKTILLPPNQELVDIDTKAADLFDLSLASHTQGLANKAIIDLSYARQGEEVIQLVKDSITEDDPYSVAFIDVRMPPGIDGVETARKVQKIDPNIEVAFVTAYADKSLEEMSEALGERPFFYVKKPYHPDEIRQLSQALLIQWTISREREQLDREKQIFTDNMSHELRHPIHVIQGICDTLLKCEVDEERRNGFIQDIWQEVQHLGNLVEKLKTINRETDDIIWNEFTDVNLTELATQTVRFLSKDAEKKGLQLSADVPDEDIWIKGEANALMQVFTNLVVNAIKYTNEGQIDVRLKLIDKEVEVTVIDTGIGIGRSEQGAIFNRYYRIKESASQVRGHGLGLSIVKDILKVHGSRIILDSKLGSGSRFSFKLPLLSIHSS